MTILRRFYIVVLSTFPALIYSFQFVTLKYAFSPYNPGNIYFTSFRNYFLNVFGTKEWPEEFFQIHWHVCSRYYAGDRSFLFIVSVSWVRRTNCAFMLIHNISVNVSCRKRRGRAFRSIVMYNVSFSGFIGWNDNNKQIWTVDECARWYVVVKQDRQMVAE